MYIIQFILIVFFVAFIAVGVAIWRAWRRIKHATEQFQQQMGGGQQNKRKDSTYNNQSARTTKTDSGDTIIDTRSPEKANQKIFPKDEGEYVDYKSINN